MDEYCSKDSLSVQWLIATSQGQKTDERQPTDMVPSEEEGSPTEARSSSLS